MADQLTNQQWQIVWQLVREAESRPPSTWRTYVASADSDPRIVQQALAVMEASSSWHGGTPGPAGGQSATRWTGMQLRQYRVGPLLGAGGAGAVYVAKDETLGRLAALKFLSVERLGTTAVRNQVLREARAASALNHPHIVTVFEVVETGEATVIAMELVEGVTLREHCAGPVPPDSVILWGRQLAQALAAAHGQGLIHGDIKPENVMVRNDGYVKLLDFGLAHEAQQTAAPLAGTWRYLSPEQCRGDALTSASDIFAFGTLLYELSTGRHPFQAESLVGVFNAIGTLEPEPIRKLNPAVSPEVDALIHTMLAKDPASRPAAQEVAKKLAPAGYRKSSKIRLATSGLTVAAVAALAVAYWLRPMLRPTLRQVTMHVNENRVTAAAIAPDARLLAFANLNNLWVRPLPDGQPEEIETPPDFQIAQMAWFPGGKRLLISGASAKTFESSIWVVSRNEGKPQLISRKAVRGAVSADGQRVAFLTENRAEIVVCDADGSHVVTAMRTAGDIIGALFWSPAGRLLYSREPARGPDWLESLDVDTHLARTIYRNTGKASAGPMVIESASYLASGRVLYLRFDPPDSYFSYNLWELRTDRTTGAAIGNPRKLTDFQAARLDNLSVSQDERTVSVVQASGTEAVFVGEFNSAKKKLVNARRLTFQTSIIHPHAWTPDSKAVIFESDVNGTFDIFRQSIDRRTPENLVLGPDDDFVPAVTPDARWLVYCVKPRTKQSGPGVSRVMRVPLNGGEPREIARLGLLDDVHCAYPGQQRAGVAPCVARVLEDQGFRFVALDPMSGLGKTITSVSRPGYFIFGDWDLSPDGSVAAMPNRDPRMNHVRVIPLYPAGPADVEREVEVTGRTNLHGLNWTADGKGWFLTVNSMLGRQMIYSDLTGQSVALGVRGWAVAAPDGRHLAFKDDVQTGNVYFVDRLR